MAQILSNDYSLLMLLTLQISACYAVSNKPLEVTEL